MHLIIICTIIHTYLVNLFYYTKKVCKTKGPDDINIYESPQGKFIFPYMRLATTGKYSILYYIVLNTIIFKRVIT